MKQKYPFHAWILRTLCRPWNQLGIKFVDHNTKLVSIRGAVRKEVDEPGGLSRYCVFQRGGGEKQRQGLTCVSKIYGLCSFGSIEFGLKKEGQLGNLNDRFEEKHLHQS